MKMMKQVVVVKPQEFEVREVPVPEIGTNDVLVQMKSSGVCGSDQHLYHGANPNSTYPRVPGHENAGIIVEVGAEVTSVQVGEHVIVDLVHACGECYQCKTGRRNVCEQVTLRGSSMDGGWSEYIAVPQNEVFPIDKKIRWEDAALVEPYAIGEHCTTRGRVSAQESVLIFGMGTIGAIILQAVKRIGCETIICCDVSDDALERAKEFGASHVINTRSEDLVEKVQEYTNGKGVNVSIDAVGIKGTLYQCMQKGVLANAGRVVPLGFSTAEEGITQQLINQRELEIIGSRMSAYKFEPTIAKMESGEINTTGIATKFVKFSEINDLFYSMDHPDASSRKMVVLFD